MKSSDILIEALDQATSKWLMGLDQSEHQIVREKIFKIITGEDEPAVELGTKFGMFVEISSGRYNVVFSVYFQKTVPVVRILKVRDV